MLAFLVVVLFNCALVYSFLGLALDQDCKLVLLFVISLPLSNETILILLRVSSMKRLLTMDALSDDSDTEFSRLCLDRPHNTTPNACTGQYLTLDGS